MPLTVAGRELRAMDVFGRALVPGSVVAYSTSKAGIRVGVVVSLEPKDEDSRGDQRLDRVVVAPVSTSWNLDGIPSSARATGSVSFRDFDSELLLLAQEQFDTLPVEVKTAIQEIARKKALLLRFTSCGVESRLADNVQQNPEPV